MPSLLQRKYMESKYGKKTPAPLGGAEDQPPKVEKEPANQDEKRLRQNAPQPLCPYCSKPGSPVACKSNRSELYFTRYYCPTDGCTYSMKVPKPKRNMQEDIRRSQRNEDDGYSAR